MPKTSAVRPFNREAPDQKETFRYGPNIEPAAHPVDAFVRPGDAPHVPVGGDAAAFVQTLEGLSRTAMETRPILKDMAEKQETEGRAAAARGEKVQEASKAFFKGYYQMKAVADSAEFIKELDAYNDRNWGLPDEEYSKGRDAIKQRYTEGMPDDYMVKFGPIAADTTAKLELNRNNKIFESAKQQYFTNAGKVVNDQLDAGVPPEEVRGALSRLQLDGLAMGLDRTKVTEGLLAVIGTRASQNPDLAHHLKLFYIKDESGIAPVDNPAIATKVRAYEELVEREILERQRREEHASRLASDKVKNELMVGFSSGALSVRALETQWKKSAHLMDAADNSFFYSIIKSERASSQTVRSNVDYERGLAKRLILAEEDPVALQNEIAHSVEKGLLTPDDGMKYAGQIRRKTDSENTLGFNQGKERIRALLPSESEARLQGIDFDPQGIALINARERVVADEIEKKRKLTDKEIRSIFDEEVQQAHDLIRTMSDPKLFMEKDAKGKDVPIVDSRRRRELLHWRNVMEADPANQGQLRLGEKARSFDAFVQYKTLTGQMSMTIDEYYAKVDAYSRPAPVAEGAAPPQAAAKPEKRKPAGYMQYDQEDGSETVSLDDILLSLGFKAKPGTDPEDYMKRNDPRMWKMIWEKMEGPLQVMSDTPIH